MSEEMKDLLSRKQKTKNEEWQLPQFSIFGSPLLLIWLQYGFNMALLWPYPEETHKGTRAKVKKK